MNEEEKYCYEDRSEIPVCHAVNRHARTLTALLCAVGAVVLTLLGAVVGAVLGAAREQRGHQQNTNVIFYEGNDFSAQLKNENGQFTLAGVADFVKDSVVEVSAALRGRNADVSYTQAGSGLVVSADGFIVTDYTIIENAEEIKVRLGTTGQSLRASLYAKDAISNLAILRIQATGLTPVCFGDSDRLVMGQEVLAVAGAASGNGLAANNGIVSVPQCQVTAGVDRYTAIQTTAYTGKGSRGGGLFNMAGQLVGFFYESSDCGNGAVYALPANKIRPWIKDLVEKKYVSGRVNCGMISLREYESSTEWLPVGVYVCAINAPETPFQVGDAILAVNEDQVDGIKEWTRILNRYHVGDEVSVEVKRDGEVVVLTITLEELVR